VSSWDAQQAGLAREDICGDNNTGDIDTTGVEDTTILDQACQNNGRPEMTDRRRRPEMTDQRQHVRR